MLSYGPAALYQPPAAFAAMQSAARRQDAARRYYAMTENEDLGVRMTWIGKDKQPKSDWHYDYSQRQDYLQALGEAAGLFAPKPKVSAANDELAAWQALRQSRRIRA